MGVAGGTPLCAEEEVVVVVVVVAVVAGAVVVPTTLLPNALKTSEAHKGVEWMPLLMWEPVYKFPIQSLFQDPFFSFSPREGTNSSSGEKLSRSSYSEHDPNWPK